MHSNFQPSFIPKGDVGFKPNATWQQKNNSWAKVREKRGHSYPSAKADGK